MLRRLLLGRWVLLWIAGAVVIVDQLSKLAVRGAMRDAQSIPIVPGIFHLTYIRNPGAAFGLMPGKKLFFFATTALVIACIVIYYLRARPVDPILVVALGLGLGGTLGNLIDRAVWGKVTDFFDFRVWPVFNIADASVVVGLALMLLVVIKHSRQEEQKREAA